MPELDANVFLLFIRRLNGLGIRYMVTGSVANIRTSRLSRSLSPPHIVSDLDRVLDCADALEQLFGRRVDLLTEESIRNPYLRSEVEVTRQLVYGRPGQEAAA